MPSFNILADTNAKTSSRSTIRVRGSCICARVISSARVKKNKLWSQRISQNSVAQWTYRVLCYPIGAGPIKEMVARLAFHLSLGFKTAKFNSWYNREYSMKHVQYSLWQSVTICCNSVKRPLPIYQHIGSKEVIWHVSPDGCLVVDNLDWSTEISRCWSSICFWSVRVYPS